MDIKEAKQTRIASGLEGLNLVWGPARTLHKSHGQSIKRMIAWLKFGRRAGSPPNVARLPQRGRERGRPGQDRAAILVPYIHGASMPCIRDSRA